MYRRYEKDRRSRFNASLDKLASLLPDFAEANNGDSKWTKCQILDNAIKYIQSVPDNVENTNPNNEKDGNAKLIKILKKQNKKLREIVRNECVPHLNEKEFCSLDFPQLYEIIKSKRSQDAATANANNDAGDVFVVATENHSSTDHTYSLIVHQEAEVEIGDEMTVVEEEVVILDQDNAGQHSKGIIPEVIIKFLKKIHTIQKVKVLSKIQF